MRTAITIDYIIIAVYMLLMLAIGIYFMRFNKGASDYFKGGNRIPWLVAGISSFMSGFSAFTFTGAAGIAYREGVAAIALYIGNACTFLLGYWIFGVRWRRSRITTTMEYLSERFDQQTRQAFSVTTGKVDLSSTLPINIYCPQGSTTEVSRDFTPPGVRKHKN